MDAAQAVSQKAEIAHAGECTLRTTNSCAAVMLLRKLVATQHSQSTFCYLSLDHDLACDVLLQLQYGSTSAHTSTEVYEVRVPKAAREIGGFFEPKLQQASVIDAWLSAHVLNMHQDTA